MSNDNSAGGIGSLVKFASPHRLSRPSIANLSSSSLDQSSAAYSLILVPIALVGSSKTIKLRKAEKGSRLREERLQRARLLPRRLLRLNSSRSKSLFHIIMVRLLLRLCPSITALLNVSLMRRLVVACRLFNPYHRCMRNTLSMHSLPNHRRGLAWIMQVTPRDMSHRLLFPDECHKIIRLPPKEPPVVLLSTASAARVMLPCPCPICTSTSVNFRSKR